MCRYFASTQLYDFLMDARIVQSECVLKKKYNKDEIKWEHFMRIHNTQIEI